MIQKMEIRELPHRSRIIDFHSHYYDAAWSMTQTPSVPHAWPLLTSITGQLTAMEAAGIDAKVLSAPSATLVPPGQPLAYDLMQRINDRFAALVTAHPEHLLALATIDAFQGEAAAREVERAIQSLGLHGICLDCAQGQLLLDAAAARPTLLVAAELGVPVFVHPVSPAGLTERLAGLGHTGVLLARGTENAASILALLRSGLLEAHPRLQIVLPMIGLAALFLAGMVNQADERDAGWQGLTPEITRQRLYVDTMGFDPASIRFLIELLGIEQVVLGSDWPIMPIMSHQKIAARLAPLKLTEAETEAILGGNTLRLLGQRPLEEA